MVSNCMVFRALVLLVLLAFGANFAMESEQVPEAHVGQEPLETSS